MASDSAGGASGFRDRSCLSSSLSLLWVNLLSCGGGRGGVGFGEGFPFGPTDDILQKARRGTPREMFKNGGQSREMVVGLLDLDQILLVIRPFF